MKNEQVKKNKEPLLKNRRWLLFFSLFVFLCSFVFCQSAERLEVLLNTAALSYEQAAAFVLEAADIQMRSEKLEMRNGEEFKYAKDRGWLFGNVDGGDRVRLDSVSLLVMKAFELKGGAFYTLFQNPHYAYRELQYKKMIEGKNAPAMLVSGDMLLFILSRVLSHTDGNSP